MQRFERDTTPELPGDELRALNRGDDGPLTFLHLPEQKSAMSSSNSSAADLRQYVDDAPIYKYRPSLTAVKQYQGDDQEKPINPSTPPGGDEGDGGAGSGGVKAAAAGLVGRIASSTGLNGRLALAICAAAFGSAFQHGYNTGVLNGAQIAMENFINQTYIERHGEGIEKTSLTRVWSIIMALYCIGGIFGGLMTSIASDKLGRKGGLLWNNILVVIGAGLEALSKPSGSYEMIYVGRFILGINSGLNAGLAPMYLSEISPVHLRGAIGTVYQLVLTISILVAQILGLEALMGNDRCWPWLLAVTVLPAVFQVATLPLCPESPKYILLTKGREVETQNALTWFRGTIEVHDELDQMRTEYETMKAVPRVTLGDMLTSQALRMPLIIACVIMLGQQFSGINAVFFFSVSIFKTAGLSVSAAQWATISIGVMNVLMTFVSLVLVEKAGRKTLLLVGFVGMLVNVVLLWMCLVFKDLGQWISYLSILWVILFVVMFAVGPGSIPWFLVTELFSQGGRPLATSIAVALNWTANSIVAVSFLQIEDAIGAHVFGIFAVLLVVFITFTWFKVPETKNKTVEEIAAIFRQRGYQQ